MKTKEPKDRPSSRHRAKANALSVPVEAEKEVAADAEKKADPGGVGRHAPSHREATAEKPVKASRKQPASMTSKRGAPSNRSQENAVEENPLVQEKSPKLDRHHIPPASIEKELVADTETIDDLDGKEVETPYIVGIGASAGGLEALEKFFRAMPDNSGMTFVVVTHLQPDQVSVLPQLIGQVTPMKVRHIKDGDSVKPNEVYIIPPGSNVGMFNRTLQLFPRDRERPATPINYFLRSLAQDHHEHAVAIILSGTGTDGSDGVRAIKSELGMIMAQEPETAKFAGMPQAAISTGLVDFIVPPQEMPARLQQYVLARDKTPREFTVDQPTREALQKIFFVLRNTTGHDFSQYKKPTLLRRIDRRMRVHGLDNVQQYFAFIQRDNKEVIALFRDLLIGVTDFFRDKEAFEVLKSKVLPSLLGNLQENAPFRVWVPGAATGEEAYSNAIMVLEYMYENSANLQVQIFATDINDDAIEVARRGVYPASIETHVSPERLSRFFTREEQGYRIARAVREMVVFSTQNLIKDPPFTKLDLICCRNLLIYLDMELQKKVIPLFHYSLRPDGVLFLGSSESVGAFTDLFSSVDPKWKIFKRRPGSTHQPPARDFALPERKEEEHEKPAAPHELPIPKQMERQLLDFFAPTSIVINPHGDIVYVHGRTGRYLEPAPGHPTMNAFAMAREGLSAQLPGLVRKAYVQRNVIRYPGMRVKTNGETSIVNLTIQPMPGAPNSDGLVLIVFDEEADGKAGKRQSPKGKKTSSYVNDIERELENTRENLQTTIEELQTSNEELRSMNEEYQSTNEELQSANEELETSREEMQSLNEELSSVNDELQEKMEEMSLAQEALQSAMNSLDIPSVFVDSHLNVRRFTSQAQLLVNLQDGDVGRPLAHFSTNLKSVDLVKESKRTLELRRRTEREIQGVDNNWYLMRLLPYRPTASDGDEGVVITFVEIQALKSERKALDVARAANDYAHSVIESVFDVILIVDERLNVVAVNAAFLTRFSLDIHDAVGKPLTEVGAGRWNVNALADILQAALRSEGELENVVVSVPHGDRKILVRSRLLDVAPDSECCQVLIVMRDV